MQACLQTTKFHNVWTTHHLHSNSNYFSEEERVDKNNFFTEIKKEQG